MYLILELAFRDEIQLLRISDMDEPDGESNERPVAVMKDRGLS
jgi:hypothetical protein